MIVLQYILCVSSGECEAESWLLRSSKILLISSSCSGDIWIIRTVSPVVLAKGTVIVLGLFIVELDATMILAALESMERTRIAAINMTFVTGGLFIPFLSYGDL